jgi:hypothetical protein
MELYSYSRLEPGQIRLLLLERRPADNQLQGSIITRPLSKSPRFEALSYLWGQKDKVKKFFIGCDKPIFEVWENLYTALHTIMALTDAGEPRTLWIDQICTYSYRTATKCCRNLRFRPQFCEGFGFASEL